MACSENVLRFLLRELETDKTGLVENEMYYCDLKF